MQNRDEQFLRGCEEFNARKFFEAHETWEALWLHAPVPEKTFLQGIIQVSAAFHHYRRGNRVGAKSLLHAGLKKLESFPAQYHGLQVEPLRASVRNWLEVLASGKDPGSAALPRIAWARQANTRRAHSRGDPPGAD